MHNSRPPPPGGYNPANQPGMYQQQRPMAPPPQGGQPPMNAYNSGAPPPRTGMMPPPQVGPPPTGPMNNKMSANVMAPGGQYPSGQGGPPPGPGAPPMPNQVGRGPPPPSGQVPMGDGQKGFMNAGPPPPGGMPGQYNKPVANNYGPHGPPPRIAAPPTSIHGPAHQGPPPTGQFGGSSQPGPPPQSMYQHNSKPAGPPPMMGGGGGQENGVQNHHSSAANSANRGQQQIPSSPPVQQPLNVPQVVNLIKSPSTGSLGHLPLPKLQIPPSGSSPTPGDFLTSPADSSGPPSQRSSAAPSPIPSQRYDALEGGTPYDRPNFEVGPPSAGPSPTTGPPPPGGYGATPGLAAMRPAYPGGPPIRHPGPPPSGAGPPPGGAPGQPPPMTGGVRGPPPPGGQSIGRPGVGGRRMYPNQPGGQPQYPPPGGGMDGRNTATPPPTNAAAVLPPQHGLGQQVPNNVHQPQGQQPTMNNVNAGMSNLRLQQGDTRPVNLLQERHIIPTTPVQPPKNKLSADFQNKQVDPDVFRSTISTIPQTQTLLQKSRLPLGLIIHPFKDLSHLPVIQSSVIVRCRSCRTYINPFVTFIDQRRWKCNLCHRINDLPEEFSFDPVTKTYGEPQRRPEVKSATIEFIAPSEYMLRPPQPAVYLFMLDVSFAAVESGYLSVVCQILMDELGKMPGDARTMMALLTFDSTLHFYSLQEGMTRPQMMVVSDLEDVFLPCPNDLLINIQECKELLKDLFSQIPGMFEGNKNTQTALGPALQAAHKLLSATGGRVTVFQSGLPSAGAGALKAREDPNQRANAKHIANLGPAIDFYKKMALDFSAQQVAVDLFLLSSQYTDIATLGGVSKYSGGSMHYYPGFHTTQNPVQVERFSHDFRRYLTRKIGFEAVMRVRCTRGLTIHTFHGNFFVRSTDLLSLPNISPDAGFGMQLNIDESLHDSSVASFQAALLYTSSKGERRIRVHTMCLPVTNQLSEVMAAADQQAIVCLLSRMAVDKSVMNSMSDARDAIVNVCLDSLTAYKATLPTGQTMGGSLMCPHSLRLLPAYMLALLKNTAFRLGASTKLDERVFAMEMFKSQPIMYIMLKVHPNMYPVHELDDEGSLLISDQSVPQPPIIGLSSEYINRNGAYLMDCGDQMLLFVNREVTPQWCQEVLDVPDFQSIPEGMTEVPELPNPMSERLHSFIEWLQDKRPWHAPLRIIREDSKQRMVFLEHLIQDRSEASMSYYEFLQHIQKEVK